MKKIKSLFLLCAGIMLLSGCTLKYEYNLSINEDKSMDFSVVLAMDEELIDGMLSMENMSDEEIEPTDEERWAIFEQSMEEEGDPTADGFKAERYREGEFYGYKYSKKITNIDDISGDTADFKLEDFQNISDKIVFIKDGNVYKANLVLSSEEQSENTGEFDVGIDMLFVVTLPDKAINHNATTVSEDGKTLTWDLLEESSKNIEFEFSFPENTNTILYIGIAAGVIAALAIIGFIISKITNNNTTETTAQPTVVPIEQPINPVQPVNQESVIEDNTDVTIKNNNEQ